MTKAIVRLACVPAWFVLAPFQVIEYLAHRFFMHRQWRGNPNYRVKDHLEHHAGENRPMWKFTDLRFREYVLFSLPFHCWFIVRASLFGAWWAWIFSAWLLSATLLHSLIYTRIHRRTHDLVPHDWTSHIPGIERLHAHHLLHHRRPDRNFGVTCRWTDRLFGTLWRG